jgi:preprotein translocase subunit SecG
MGDILSIFAAITTLAIVAVVVNSPNTAGDATAIFGGYSNAITASAKSS